MKMRSITKILLISIISLGICSFSIDNASAHSRAYKVPTYNSGAYIVSDVFVGEYK